MTAIYSAAAAPVEESSTIELSTTDNESSSSQTTISPPPPSDFIVMAASSVVSPRPRTPPSFRRESIAVSDTGTEVTLTHAEEEDDDDEGFFTSEQPNTAVLVQRSPSSNSDKKDDDPRSRSFSLLDNDLASVVTTTTPLSPETPISSTLPLCGVVGCWSVPEETGGAAPGNSSIRSAACMEDGLQDYLYEFLSDPSSGGGGGGQKAFPWQAMLTSMADDSDEDNDEDDDDDEEREIKKHRMKILRNRAIHLQARKERLDTLRRDLHPFSYYSGPATPPLPGVGATGSSLAMIGNGNKIMPRSHSQPISAPTKPRRRPLQDRTLLHHHHHQPEQAWSSWSCHNIQQSPGVLVWEEDVQGGHGENGHYSCYDSDPEDSLRSRNNYTPPPSAPPAAAAPVKNKRKSAFNSTNHNSNNVVVSDDLYAGNNTYDIVHGAFNERWTFILHPQSGQQPQQHGNPCAVQAWMERGQRLCTTVIPPKLVYQFIGKQASPSSSALQQQGQHQQRPRLLGNTTSPLYSIDLLEIQRVLEMHRVNRELYPFAKAQSTFTITTLHETICLEASSQSERDRFVRLLKLLVARFGSQLVTGDIRVEEFFTMIGNGPGGAQVEYNRYL